MSYPTVPAMTEQLRRYMENYGLTTAATVALIDIFSGSTWSATLIDDVLAGRKKFTAYQEEIIRLFMLDRFFHYNTT